jgi:hypothetical protein
MIGVCVSFTAQQQQQQHKNNNKDNINNSSNRTERNNRSQSSECGGRSQKDSNAMTSADAGQTDNTITRIDIKKSVHRHRDQWREARMHWQPQQQLWWLTLLGARLLVCVRVCVECVWSLHSVQEGGRYQADLQTDRHRHERKTTVDSTDTDTRQRQRETMPRVEDGRLAVQKLKSIDNVRQMCVAQNAHSCVSPRLRSCVAENMSDLSSVHTSSINNIRRSVGGICPQSYIQSGVGERVCKYVRKCVCVTSEGRFGVFSHCCNQLCI